MRKKRIILGPLQVDHENFFSLVWIVLASEGGGEEMKSGSGYIQNNDDDDDIYIYYDECLSVCNEKSSLPPGSLL